MQDETWIIDDKEVSEKREKQRKILYNDPQFLEGRQPNTMRGKELSWQIKRKWALLH